VPTTDDIEVRRARPDDRAAVVELCRETLRWDPTAPNEAFFSWKHDDNPFGASPMWVALDGDRIVGLRAFLRWRFRRASGEVAEAVRAVDTATHPSAQGRGIFTRLTLGALEELAEDGVDFIFNTPNDQSRPGYLKMGWSVVGRTPLAFHPRSPLTLVRLLRRPARAEKWSQPTEAGEDPLAVFVDDGTDLAASSRPDGWTTDRSVAYHRWRYSFGPLHYRVFMAGSGLADGAAVFRLHRRGDALEATVVDTLGRPLSIGAWRRLLRLSGADYLIRSSAGARPLSGGFIPLPRAGPILTQRYLDDARRGTTDRFSLSLSDVELF
jgi:GNAT superfamily N-acetyltransferase